NEEQEHDGDALHGRPPFRAPTRCTHAAAGGACVKRCDSNGVTVPKRCHETARVNFAAKIVNGDNARAMTSILFAILLAATPQPPTPPPDLAAPPPDAQNLGNGMITKVLVPGRGPEVPSDEDVVKIRYTLWSSPDGKLLDH